MTSTQFIVDENPANYPFNTDLSPSSGPPNIGWPSEKKKDGARTFVLEREGGANTFWPRKKRRGKEFFEEKKREASRTIF